MLKLLAVMKLAQAEMIHRVSSAKHHLFICANVNKNAPNKSLDVRAKQRLSYHVVRQISAGLAAVSHHVNSVVRLLSVL